MLYGQEGLVRLGQTVYPPVLKGFPKSEKGSKKSLVDIHAIFSKYCESEVLQT